MCSHPSGRKTQRRGGLNVSTPRTARWVAASAAGLFAIAVGYITPADAASTEQQQKLEQTRVELAKTKETQNELAAQEEKARSEFERLQNRSAELAERLQVSERRVSVQEKSLTAVNAKLSAKEKEFETRKAEYAATITTLMRLRELPVTALFAQPEEMHALLRTATVLEETNKAVARKAQQLRKDLAELKDLKQDAAERRRSTRAETEGLNIEQDKLDRALGERQKLQARLSADRSKANEKIASLSRESESLQTLIKKLDIEEKAEESRAKQPARNKAAKRIDGAKGTLRPPVSGDIIHQFGERKTANETYRGMVLRTRSASTVVAPYDGEIVYTGPFRDYGNMLLIKHSNGYISLISGLGKLSTRIGQSVIRGEPVALASTVKDPEIYVELRDSDAKPIDPGDWFAKLSR